MAEDVLLIVGASSEVGSQYLKAYGHRYKMIYAHYNHGIEILNELGALFGEKLIIVQDNLNDVRTGGENILAKIRATNIWPNCILHCPAPKIENTRFLKADWSIFEKNLNIMVGSCVKIFPELFKQILKEKKKGYCTLILSSCTEGIPPKFETQYVTAKYALLGLMKSLSCEYSDRGIMVNGISPGMMETKFLDSIFDHVIEENAQKSPFGRNLKVEEILPMIDFLLSDRADRITGQNIVVSGGM